MQACKRSSLLRGGHATLLHADKGEQIRVKVLEVMKYIPVMSSHLTTQPNPEKQETSKRYLTRLLEKRLQTGNNVF